MQYNSSRSHVFMKEYGRHIQKLVEHAVTIQDRAKRQAVAESIVELMAILNPQLKSTVDYTHKLWDHIFVISDFKLDVDSPYDRPTRESAKIKPAKLPYPKNRIKLRHYGKNVESMVQKAMKMEDEEKRAAFTEIIGNFMKMAYKNWSQEEVSNDLIKGDMKTISGGVLEISEEMNIETMARFHRKKPNNNKNFRNGNNKNSSNSNNNKPNNNNNNRKRFNKK